jgi:hypothetical protein
MKPFRNTESGPLANADFLLGIACERIRMHTFHFIRRGAFSAMLPLGNVEEPQIRHVEARMKVITPY